MNFVGNYTELLRSCEILFGAELNITSEFLDYLQISGLKKAYRKRAKETHPDSFMSSQAMVQQSSELFHAVQESYEQLLCYVMTREQHQPRMESVMEGSTPPLRPRPPIASTTGHDPFVKCTGHDHIQRSCTGTADRPVFILENENQGLIYSNIERLYDGPLPRRPLLFGHFLYYSGLTNWRTIARILLWQRLGRPRLGEIGRRSGYLTQEDIARIIAAKTPLQPFGQTARQLGMLNAHQLQILLERQQGLQKKFGTILLEKDLVSHHQLQELLCQFAHHNRTNRRQGRN